MALFPSPWHCSLPQLRGVGFCLQYKLCKVRKIFVGTKGIPHLVTHDARTIRYPDPLIKVNDTVQIDLETGKITDFIKFDTGRSCIPLKHCTLPHWRAVWKLNARHICTEIERQWCQPWERVCFPGACLPGAGAEDSSCVLAVGSIWPRDLGVLRHQVEAASWWGGA